ncbi:FYN-binding protein 1 [Lampris incognitus]|uniref:FYN-binding protein 1 n=1 Tax=Lampris incognitus TaxID=2546036 RepID=UPI0024B49ABC|nr:FYN-binding protein 1 [Lampris incognitus]
MGESVDVKSLMAKFHNQANMVDSRSRDNGFPPAPLRIGREIPSRAETCTIDVTENESARHKLSSTVSPSRVRPGFSPSPTQFPVPPRAEPVTCSASRPQLPLGAFPRPPPTASVRAASPPADTRIKQTGEILQNVMLMHKRPPNTKPVPSPQAPACQLPSRGTAGEVIPLRRPLPPEGPRPMKPKRPPKVNLEAYIKTTRRLPLPSEEAHPNWKKSDGFPSSRGSSFPPSGLSTPPRPPNKPRGPSHPPTAVDVEDNQETYDDIGNFETSDSFDDNSSQHVEGMSDGSDVYDCIDEKQFEEDRDFSYKKTKEVKKQWQQDKIGQKEHQKRMNTLRKKFQLQGEVEVLHVAKVRHDWHGGKLDLSVRQGDSVEILRVKNNPQGRWLVRTFTGDYGYISNTCVDIDYEEVKRKVLQARGMDLPSLPPPPPDPPRTGLCYNVNSCNQVNRGMPQEEDDYDDVQPIPEDFPPPPPEISLDRKTEKELRKKFKFDGPLRVLHTMMVDPNCSIKRPGGKHLAVVQGEILDVVHLVSENKALCRNQFGKYGYVSRSLLLQMEGEIYDDIEHSNDIYDNDSIN